MANRLPLLALFASVIAAQTPPPIPPARHIVDLDGTWEAPSGGEVLTITLHHDGTSIWAVEAKPDSPDLGKEIFSGRYSGESPFIMRLMAEPGKEFAAVMKDPDTLQAMKIEFHRVSPPSIIDFPCTPDNEFHVTAAGAMARSDHAESIGEHSIAYCWAGVAGLAGDARGQYVAGTYLRKSNFPKQAFAWMLASAKAGYLQAQREVSSMYTLGEGTPQNVAEGIAWALKAEDTRLSQMNPADLIDGMIKALPSSDDLYKITIHCADGRVYQLDRTLVRIPSGMSDERICEMARRF